MWAEFREASNRRWSDRDSRVLGFLNSKGNVYIREKVTVIVET